MTCVGKYHVQWNVLYLTLIQNNAMHNNAIRSLMMLLFNLVTYEKASYAVCQDALLLFSECKTNIWY